MQKKKRMNTALHSLTADKEAAEWTWPAERCIMAKQRSGGEKHEVFFKPAAREHTNCVCVQTTCSHTFKWICQFFSNKMFWKNRLVIFSFPSQIYLHYGQIFYVSHVGAITQWHVDRVCSAFLWCERTWLLKRGRTEKNKNCQALIAPLFQDTRTHTAYAILSYTRTQRLKQQQHTVWHRTTKFVRKGQNKREHWLLNKI